MAFGHQRQRRQLNNHSTEKKVCCEAAVDQSNNSGHVQGAAFAVEEGDRIRTLCLLCPSCLVSY